MLSFEVQLVEIASKLQNVQLLLIFEYIFNFSYFFDDPTFLISKKWFNELEFMPTFEGTGFLSKYWIQSQDRGPPLWQGVSDIAYIRVNGLKVIVKKVGQLLILISMEVRYHFCTKLIWNKTSKFNLQIHMGGTVLCLAVCQLGAAGYPNDHMESQIQTTLDDILASRIVAT